MHLDPTKLSSAAELITALKEIPGGVSADIYTLESGMRKFYFAHADWEFIPDPVFADRLSASPRPDGDCRRENARDLSDSSFYCGDEEILNPLRVPPHYTAVPTGHHRALPGRDFAHGTKLRLTDPADFRGEHFPAGTLLTAAGYKTMWISKRYTGVIAFWPVALFPDQTYRYISSNVDAVDADVM